MKNLCSLWHILFLYAFRPAIQMELDKLFYHPIDHRRKALISVDLLPPKCVDKRGFSALVFRI